MRKTTAALCLAALLLLLLCACGGSGGGSAAGLCTDQTILAMLKNDDSPEFVLEGVYYSLPTGADSFIRQGWTMTVDRYEDEEVLLQPGERVDVRFEKEGIKLGAVAANDGILPLDAAESSIIRISLFEDPEKLPEDLLVTKYGVRHAASPREVKAALKDKAGFKESGERLYLQSEGELGGRDILYYSPGSGYVSIRIESAADHHYKQYKSMAEKAQEQTEEIAACKAEAEANSPKDYDQIVSALDTKLAIPFCSLEGTVLLKGTGNYEGMEDDLLLGQDLSLYVVQDSSGQVYCIYEGYVGNEGILKLPELAEGDVIALWGFASKITKFDDGRQAPTVIPKVIEKDGELFYLSQDLRID